MRVHELRTYHNQGLMDATNFMFVRIKKYIYFREKYPNAPPPSSEELDELMHKLFHVLRKDSEPMRKY